VAGDYASSEDEDIGMGDVVRAKEHHLSKAVEGFVAKLAPKYDGPYRL